MPKKLYPWGHVHTPTLFNSEDMAEGARERTDKLDGIFNSATTRIKAIKTDGMLTTKGMQSAFADLRVEIQKELNGWQSALGDYADQIRQLKEAMAPTRHRRDDIAWQLELREIRDYFRTLDPLDQEAFYRQAAEEGTDQILEAIEHSPLPFRFATKNLIDKISTQRLERQYPEQAAKLADLLTAQETAGSALKSVRAELAAQGIETRGEDPTVADAA